MLARKYIYGCVNDDINVTKIARFSIGEVFWRELYYYFIPGFVTLHERICRLSSFKSLLASLQYCIFVFDYISSCLDFSCRWFQMEYVGRVRFMNCATLLYLNPNHRASHSLICFSMNRVVFFNRDEWTIIMCVSYFLFSSHVYIQLMASCLCFTLINCNKFS